MNRIGRDQPQSFDAAMCARIDPFEPCRNRRHKRAQIAPRMLNVMPLRRHPRLFSLHRPFEVERPPKMGILIARA
jgi:hypothetical protein